VTIKYILIDCVCKIALNRQPTTIKLYK